MGISNVVDIVKQTFSRHTYHNPPDITHINTSDTVPASQISKNAAQYLVDLYNWNGMSAQDLYEHLLIHEPEIASYVTKMSEMVRSSFDYFMLINDSEFDNIEEYTDENGVVQTDKTVDKKLLDKMKDTANDIARRNDIARQCFEIWSTIMFSQGEVFLKKNSDLSLSIIPNNRVTIVDERQYIRNGTPLDHLITNENYLIVDEGLHTQTILYKDQFIHIKISDVPINLKDTWGRATFGIYAISPLQRCLASLWLKGQILVTETLWRWGNVPREHHTLAAEAFSPEQYKGIVGKDKIIEYATNQMNAAIQRHSASISKKNPDQHYVTSSNVAIKPIEHSSSDYMDSNNLLNQIENSIWDGLCTPASVIRGESDGSYASELIISSGVSLRIEQIATKIGKVVLENIKERLTEMDPSYPVRYLDIKISFELAESKLEKYKVLSMQTGSGLFTPTECRETVDYPVLTKEQINKEGLVTKNGIIVGEENLFNSTFKEDQNKQAENKVEEKVEKKEESKSAQNFGGIEGNRSNGTTKYPTTPKSASTQPTDKGDTKYKDKTDLENYR